MLRRKSMVILLTYFIIECKITIMWIIMFKLKLLKYKLCPLPEGCTYKIHELRRNK